MPYVIVCRNCEIDAENRGRGLCPRCYQFLWRKGELPWPNRVSVEEIIGARQTVDTHNGI